VIRYVVLVIFCFAPGPVVACRLALLLALDVSSSIDEGEYALQRRGLAAALTAPEVMAAFLETQSPVALAVFEWSGRFNQQIILPWTLVESRVDLQAAAGVVASTERNSKGFQTALGHALGFASRYFGEAPSCMRQTIDVSGDGESNHGFTPAEAYRSFPLDRGTVNALAIGQSVGTDNLVVYYRSHLIQGVGSFVEEARDYVDFERAMRRKLQREVSSLVVGSR